MKQFIPLVTLMMALSFAVNAQTSSINFNKTGISNFKAVIDNNNLLVNWNADEIKNSNYWEVQGSVDGQSFTTIGLVLGAVEGAINPSFKFKQQLNKMKPGLKFYRVLHIEKDDTAISSGIIQSAK